MGGGILDSKAFTLIELLAIIVILAIIAVITIPIILNVIENSRKGAAIDSAYGYKDAVNKYYVSQMIDKQDFKLDGFYVIDEEGILTDENNVTHTISTSGTTPSGGYLGIENNEVIYECLNIGDYKVMLEDGTITAEKGKCKEVEQQFNEGNPTYFDPEKGKVCTMKDYEENELEHSKSEDKDKQITNGCMKWYVLNGTGASVDLLLDHDTTKYVAWALQVDYESAKNAETIKSEYGITYPNNEVPTYIYSSHSKGPLTALAKLKADTEDWSDSLIRNDSHSVSLPNATIHPINYTIDYTGYKARMVTAEEVAKITKQANTKLQDISEFNLESYTWLNDNTGVYNYGYWTSSPFAGDTNSAWNVSDSLSNSGISNAGQYGVRPVITVSKSKLLSE